MKIPLAEKLPPDIRIQKGRYKGMWRYYKTALLNTLIHLRPRICLEIGTWRGGSARIFERYFRDYCPDGLLVTADIRRFVDIQNKRMHQVQVYPHRSIKKKHLLPDWEDHLDDSAEANCAILRRELDEVGVDAFDFAFVDGDHAAQSLSRDLIIVEALSAPPHYTLLDDIQVEFHESSQLYRERLMHEYSHYDFEDWDLFVGTALVWR